MGFGCITNLTCLITSKVTQSRLEQRKMNIVVLLECLFKMPALGGFYVMCVLMQLNIKQKLKAENMEIIEGVTIVMDSDHPRSAQMMESHYC